MNRHVEIIISKKTLKSCVEHDGNLIMYIDFDATKADHFPQGDERFLRSKKNDAPENYNDDICLVENHHTVYVNGESFALKDAQFRTIKILYEQSGHKIHYKTFAELYSGEDTSDSERCNTVAHSAIKHSNNYFKKNQIPLVIKRDDTNLWLEKTC